jgi:DNA-binding MarR family transcriptional regulator
MEDVNERVAEEWKEDTTPSERVRSIMRRTYEPEPVATIAERALTTETTARKHLGILAEDGFVEEASTPEERGTCYRRTPQSVVLERARQILDSVDADTLAERVDELHEEDGETPRRARWPPRPPRRDLQPPSAPLDARRSRRLQASSRVGLLPSLPSGPPGCGSVRGVRIRAPGFDGLARRCPRRTT